MKPNTMQLRKSADRGHANHGWLDSYHSFSFARYYDPAHMGYSVLRVINEDVIAPAKGFGMHPHNDMEIITYMLQGDLQHKDSLGNGSVIKAGDVQRMTAGTGIVHSEFNASNTHSAHLLQIWILPDRDHLQPGYEQNNFTASQKQDRWCLIASQDGHDGSLLVHQDMALYATILSADVSLDYALNHQRSVYIQVVIGEVEISGQHLVAGDALMLDGPISEGTTQLTVKASAQAELLLFDLPVDTTNDATH
ncbi:MAG: pirin family protein [Methylotenera sp.]